MKKSLVLLALASVLAGCSQGNLGFYLYPQAAPTGISEVEAPSPLGGLEVVGYLPGYKIPTLDASQVRHLTDLVYFTLAVRPDGTLYRDVLTPERVDFLKKVKHEFGTRIHLGIADHEAAGNLAAVAKKPALRKKFALWITALLDEFGFDGVDFDWEYPRPADLPAYAALLSAVHDAFAPKGYRLSVAISPWRPLTAAAYEVVDRVHGMLYDDEGRHSTLENAASHVLALLKQGVPAGKLLMGIPFYGRGYTRTGPAWSSAVSYRTLQQRNRLSAEQDTVGGYYYNGPATIRRKVQLAKADGLAGVMVWEIAQDTNDASSLLAVITRARKDLTPAN